MEKGQMSLQRRYIFIIFTAIFFNCWYFWNNERINILQMINKQVTPPHFVPEVAMKIENDMMGISYEQLRVTSKTSQYTRLIQKNIFENVKFEELSNPIKSHQAQNHQTKLNVDCFLQSVRNPYCLQYNFRRLLSPKWTCQGTVFLVIMVTSIPGHSDRRNVLRKTWCTDFNSIYGSVQHIFLFGKTNSRSEQEALAREASIHGDILQDDFVEDYRNMTIKTIMGFRWFHEHCTNASYVMKCDDDMFINVFYLLHYLMEKLDIFRNALLGRCYKCAHIHRNPDHRWYVAPLQLNQSCFSSYCGGTGYVLGSNLAHNVAALMPSIPIFPIEDAYVGQCVKYLQGKVISVSGFSLSTEVYSTPFLKSAVQENNVFTVHRANDTIVKMLWRSALH